MWEQSEDGGLTWRELDDLELPILLPQPPTCWDYRHAPRGQDHAVLGLELRTLYMPGKLSTSHALSPAQWISLSEVPALVAGPEESGWWLGKLFS